jgi:hypothetical protein
MKRLSVGFLLVCLATSSYSSAMVNKEFAKKVQDQWDAYYKNQQKAEEFIKQTSQETLDALLAGKFDAKVTVEKIKNMPDELWFCVKEETLVLLAKNIRSNVKIEDYYSQEFLSDLQGVLEVPFEIYGKDNFLYPLKNGFLNSPINQALKNKILELSESTKKKITEILDKCRDFQEDSSDLMKACGEMDKETTAFVDLLTDNVSEIADLCYSEEFKKQCLTFLKDRDKVARVIKALTLRFLSEAVLDDAMDRLGSKKFEYHLFNFTASHLARDYFSHNRRYVDCYYFPCK